MKKFFQTNGYLLLAILVIAVIACIIVNMMAKQVQVDPATGEDVPGGIVTKGKLSLKGLKPTVIK